MPRRLTATKPYSGIFADEDVRVPVDEETRARLEALAGKHELKRIPFMPWAMRVPVPGVGALDFDAFPWTEEWYSDDFAYCRRGTIAKATQIGATEAMIRWALFWCDTRADTCLYVLPAATQRNAFSDERVRGMIRGSEYLRGRVPRDFVDNKALRQIGFGGFLHLRGSQREADLETTPADEVVLDEYDLLVQRHIPAAEKRLSSPTSRDLLRRIGWPTYTEVGIHGHYLRGDRRNWLVKCPKGHELPLHFFQQEDGTHHWLDPEAVHMRCGKCGAEVSRRAISDGRWVAERPDAEEISYQAGRLVVPSANYEDIIRESKLTRPYEQETFWRKTLGLPFDTAEGRLSLEAIQAAVSAGGNYFFSQAWDAPYEGSNLVTAGVDVASVRALNVRVSEHLGDGTRRALFIGTVDSFDDLYTLLVAKRVACACIDHQPEGRYARGLAAKLPGIVFTHSWGDGQTQAIRLDEQARHVSTHRTTIVDALLDSIRQRENLLPVNRPQEYDSHLRAAVKMTEEHPVTGLMRSFYKVETAHDYLQAECYDLAALHAFVIWQAIQAGQQGELVAVEGQLEGFERSRLGSWEGGGDYHAGPGGDEGYSAGVPDYGEDDGWGITR